jgi:hypothetical protein
MVATAWAVYVHGEAGRRWVWDATVSWACLRARFRTEFLA